MSGEGINLLCFHHKAVTILSRTVSHCKLLHCTMPAPGIRPDILPGRVGSTVWQWGSGGHAGLSLEFHVLLYSHTKAAVTILMVDDEPDVGRLRKRIKIPERT